MKYLKTYEELDNKPEIGDYVYVVYNRDNWLFKDETFEYAESNIGQIVDIIKDRIKPYSRTFINIYQIKYDGLHKKLSPDNCNFGVCYCPDDTSYYFIYAKDKDIKDFSKNREDLEHYITSKKYNL